MPKIPCFDIIEPRSLPTRSSTATAPKPLAHVRDIAVYVSNLKAKQKRRLPDQIGLYGDRGDIDPEAWLRALLGLCKVKHGYRLLPVACVEVAQAFDCQVEIAFRSRLGVINEAVFRTDAAFPDAATARKAASFFAISFGDVIGLLEEHVPPGPRSLADKVKVFMKSPKDVFMAKYEKIGVTVAFEEKKVPTPSAMLWGASLTMKVGAEAIHEDALEPVYRSYRRAVDVLIDQVQGMDEVERKIEAALKNASRVKKRKRADEKDSNTGARQKKAKQDHKPEIKNKSAHSS